MRTQANDVAAIRGAPDDGLRRVSVDASRPRDAGRFGSIDISGLDGAGPMVAGRSLATVAGASCQPSSFRLSPADGARNCVRRSSDRPCQRGRQQMGLAAGGGSATGMAERREHGTGRSGVGDGSDHLAEAHQPRCRSA